MGATCPTLKAVPLFFLGVADPVVPEGTMVLVQRAKVTWIVPLGATSLVIL